MCIFERLVMTNAKPKDIEENYDDLRPTEVTRQYDSTTPKDSKVDNFMIVSLSCM